MQTTPTANCQTMLQKWSSDLLQTEFISTAKKFCPGFTLDAYNREVIKNLCLYFGKDKRFESEGIGSLSRGLYLSGPVGTGKTFMLKVFFQIINNAIKMERDAKSRDDVYSSEWEMRERLLNEFGISNTNVVSTKSVVEEYVNDGFDTIKAYYPGKYSRQLFLFDDLGDEPLTSNHMGNALGVMRFVITSQYDKNTPRNMIHFTGNLNPNQIETTYGTRIRSRFREMINQFELLGPDRRH